MADAIVDQRGQTITGDQYNIALNGNSPNAITSERLAQIRQEYLAYLIKHHSRIDPRGIPQTDSELSLPLDEVYVSLTAEQEIIQEYFSEEEVEFDKTHRGETEEGERIIRYQREKNRQKEKRNEPIELPRAVRDFPHMVVLGDPGAGKTTLLRFLTVRFASACQSDAAIVLDGDGQSYGSTSILILVRVAEFADRFHSNHNLSLRSFLPDTLSHLSCSGRELEIFVEELLKEGQILLLLDGLDEVASSTDRIGIAQRIDQFIASSGGKNRVIVTSRVVVSSAFIPV